MLKLEIKMDENKILDEQKYKVESIYRTLEQAFSRYKLKSMQEPDGTLWFMDYVTKWVWYNSDDGENEDDFAVEDVLYHYTKKLSVA